MYKSKKWIWDVYSKEKWFWGNRGSKLVRLRSKAQVERGWKREKEKKMKNNSSLNWSGAGQRWNGGKTVGEYSMGFKILTNSVVVEVPLEKYSNNHGGSPK